MSQLKTSRIFTRLQSSLANWASVNSTPPAQWSLPRTEREVDQISPARSATVVWDSLTQTLLFGLEIESEGIRGTAGLHPTLWSQKSDGSLRGNHRLECVTPPLSGPRLQEAIEQYGFMASRALEPFSWRCSTHIHMNCLNLTPRQVGALILLTYVADNYFYAAGDEARRCNYNCRPASLLIPMAEFLGELARNCHRGALQKAWQILTPPRGSAGEPRYVGMNWWALRKFGTIEFRHFPATRDTEQLFRWVRMCGRLYKAATVHNTVMKVLTLSQQGPQIFGETVFGSDWNRMQYDNHEQDWQFAHEGIDCFLTHFRSDVNSTEGLHGVLKQNLVVG